MGSRDHTIAAVLALGLMVLFLAAGLYEVLVVKDTAAAYAALAVGNTYLLIAMWAFKRSDELARSTT